MGDGSQCDALCPLCEGQVGNQRGWQLVEERSEDVILSVSEGPAFCGTKPVRASACWGQALRSKPSESFPEV